MRETQADGAAEIATTAPSAASAGSDAPESLIFGWRWADALLDWAWRHPRLPLALAMVAGMLARLVLVMRSNALIDGDEAMVGIQAERILHGEFPTYFYGQAYMGSLETYLIAALFRLFGPSAWAMRAVPILLSPLLVYLTWRLTYALLPRHSRATPLLAGLAAFVAAVPPLYDAVTELRTWGGQIEVYIISLALLLATVELARRLREGAGGAELARRWAIWGFLAGLGIWVNPLIVYALITAVLWLVFPYAHRAFPGLLARLRRNGDTHPETPAAIQPARAATILAVVPGLLVGGLPAWLYALSHSGENLLVYLTQPAVSPAVSGAARQGRLVLAGAITTHYAGCIAPQVFNGMMPAEPLLYWLPLRLLLLLPPLAGILCAVWLLRRANDGAGWQVRGGLPLLFAAVITAVFCLGTSAWAASKNCEYDLAGRYAVPLVLVEPFLLLALLRCRSRGPRWTVAAPSRAAAEWAGAGAWLADRTAGAGAWRRHPVRHVFRLGHAGGVPVAVLSLHSPGSEPALWLSQDARYSLCLVQSLARQHCHLPHRRRDGLRRLLRSGGQGRDSATAGHASNREPGRPPQLHHRARQSASDPCTGA